jgi:hypothetical protein
MLAAKVGSGAVRAQRDHVSRGGLVLASGVPKDVLLCGRQFLRRKEVVLTSRADRPPRGASG